MQMVGYKYWCEWHGFRTVFAGYLVGETFECTDTNVLPIGHYSGSKIGWWDSNYPSNSGFVLLDEKWVDTSTCGTFSAGAECKV